MADYFAKNNNTNPSIKEIREAVILIRKEKLPDLTKLGTAGSFFKNPIIDKDSFEILQKGFSDMPNYLETDGKYKIPAGWLIEQCGFKGKIFGNCGVYEKQALVVVNYGGATGLEILEFSEIIQKRVYEKFLISLEREVVVI